MSKVKIDELDKKILGLISGNARTPFLEVARECGVSGAAIHQRIQKLTKLEIIKGSEFILDSQLLGFETCGFVGAFLREGVKFEHILKRLQAIPGVVEVHYTTGKYAMLIKVYAKNNKDLLELIHNNIQNIEGIASTETIISLNEAHRRQIPIE